jgi:transposase
MLAGKFERKETVRARYTLELKQEAVRLVEGEQSLAAVARALKIADQTLFI